MNAKVGKPQGVTGTATFTSGATAAAVRTPEGRYYVQSVNPHLWLPADLDPAQFAAA